VSQDQSEVLNRRAQRLSLLLREADPGVPPIAFPADRIARAARRRTVVRWRVAAAIAFLAVAAVGVQPVRAWILQAARALWGAAAGAQRAVAPRALVPNAGSSSVTFSPAAGAFALRVARPQAGGTLTVEITGGTAASAAVAGGRGAELVVLPDGLRIVNDSGSAASYVVRLPASLARIEIGIARAQSRVLIPTGAGQRWVLDLRSAP
jgi:hypothetical protein